MRKIQTILAHILWPAYIVGGILTLSLLYPVNAQTSIPLGTSLEILNTTSTGAVTGDTYALSAAAANVLSWQIVADGSALSVSTQVSLDGTSWSTTNVCTGATGCIVNLGVTAYKYVRAVQTSRTGGTVTSVMLSAARAYPINSSSVAAPTVTGNLSFSPDGTYDIGASGSGRARDIWLTRNVRLNGVIQFGGQSGISNTTDGVLTLLNGAGTDFNRLNFGGSTSSFPSIKKTSASNLSIRLADDSANGNIISGQSYVTSFYAMSSSILMHNNNPTISSGFGTSPSIVTPANGTASFRVNVGTGGVATSGVIGLATATTGWNCFANDITGGVPTRMTASTTTTATFTATSAWASGSILNISCFGY